MPAVPLPNSGADTKNAPVTPEQNAMVQFCALVAFGALRMVAGGWLTFAFIISIVGPLLAATPLVLAIGISAGGDEVPQGARAPFLVAAACLVAAGLFIADVDDNAVRLPLLGRKDVRDKWWMVFPNLIGTAAVIGFVGAVIWTVVEMLA